MATTSTRTLRRVALDANADQATRLRAIIAMSERPTTATLATLRAAVTDQDATVQQRAIERLGKVGRPEDLEVLRDVRSGNRTTQQRLRAAKVFLSYRHRLGRYRIDLPKARLAAGDDAVPFLSGAPTKAMRNRIELLAPAVPGLRLAREPIRRFECGPNEFALMLNEDVIDAGLGSLTERQSIPAVLVRYNDETGAHDPSYYFLTDPSRGGRFLVSGVRSSGRVGVHGTAIVEGSTIRFDVNATDEPLDHPLTAVGTFDLSSGSLKFEIAAVETRYSEAQQKRRRQPREVDRPER